MSTENASLGLFINDVDRLVRLHTQPKLSLIPYRVMLHNSFMATHCKQMPFCPIHDQIYDSRELAGLPE